MRYKVFGSTGMKVSEIALGTWGMGGVGWDQYDEATRIEAIHTAIDCGINFIDTAPAYNNGAAEQLLGKALAQGGLRDKVFLATKCANFFVDGKVYRKDGSRDAIRTQCEQSLINLQTDHIDLMLVHWPDPNTPFAETMQALEEMKAEGKLLHFGVSNFTKEQIEEARQFGKIEAIQPPYSMVNTSQEEMLKWAFSQQMGCMTYGSLGGGILTGKIREAKTYAPTDSRQRFYQHFHEPMFSRVMQVVAVMDEISAAHDNVPLSQIALNWSASKEYVSTCIVGAQTAAKVQENCAFTEWALSEEEIAKLDKAIDEYLK